MKLLVLGGTLFLGRAVVDAALAAGHDVTLFHRGLTNPGLFPELRHVHGDRDGGLAALAGGAWDAVVDTTGFVPRVVRASAAALRGRARTYLFVSSVSAYAEPLAPGADEGAPLAALADPDTEALTGETYGGLKATCERAAAEAFGDGTIVVRPGLIVGPHDPTDRFGYWPRRVAAGGEVLAPGRPEAPAQVIDVRDLGAWLVRLVERGGAGVYNALGPARPLAFGALLDACRAVSGSDARFTWVEEGFLLGRGVTPWVDLPLWVPRSEESLHELSVARAPAAGLELRPIEATIRDTLAFERESPPDIRPRKPGVVRIARRLAVPPGRLRAARGRQRTPRGPSTR